MFLNLIEYYENNNDHENVIKLYLLGINKEFNDVKEKLNQYINLNFSFEHAFECLEYLNTNNRRKLNNCLVLHHKISAMNINKKIIECYICLENNYSIDYKCKCAKTNICYKCYENIKICPICKVNI